ncbi:MAG: AAA family ATPase, partial [Pseudomonadota bacterium]
MFSMIGYKIYGILFEDSRSVLYRGERDSDNKPVLLKTVQSSYPRSLFEVSIRNEYEITSKLQIDGVPKPYELVRHSQGLVMIMEDKGSKPLRTFLSAKKMGLQDFLQLAISLSDILFELHNNKIIHKDINPNHIFFNPQTKAVELTGFGAASLLSFEESRFLTHGFVEETFAYVSPEQTGRMNRVLDYRTDFYSLGVTFYEILTDQLPFRVNDPLDMVHSHMAREPVRPNQINSSIPGVLSDLVIKLMAKSAEERYQSAAGLKADLNRCLMQFRNKGSVEGFDLGSQDYTENLSIPQKLYGRSKELSVLHQALEKATAWRMALIMVSGFAGIGKTSLVREMQSAIAKANGYFITGKFDQLKRNIPYGGIVKALQQLVLELLTHGRARLEQLREEILNAMGSNAQIIVDVIPEIEQLIGGQPPVMILGPVETQNRFNLVFRNFIEILCHKIKPLVIFLDDLQWVDTATLKLIELMATHNENQSLLLIGAYRSEEVDSSHPLTICLEKLKKISTPVGQIHLNPLNLNDVCHLTSDTLRQSDENVRLLAESVLQKTYGNPFFVKFFLSSLHQLGLLTFSKNKEKWQWDSVKV